jgi:hypothetical protein
MFQVIFGDDEHTASEGPYHRALKTRKWLYVAALAIIAVKSGLYNEEAAAKSFQVFTIPSETLIFSLTAGIAYLTVQYVLLLVQLGTTYDITLSERFTFRRAEQLQAARDRERTASKNRDEFLTTYRTSASAADDPQQAKEFEHIQQTVTDARRNLEALYRLQPQNRAGYKVVEVLIDLFRIIPPLLLALYAIFL